MTSNSVYNPLPQPTHKSASIHTIPNPEQKESLTTTEEMVILLPRSTSDGVVLRLSLGNLKGLPGNDDVGSVGSATPFLATLMLLVRDADTLMVTTVPIGAMTECCHVRFAWYPLLVKCGDGKLGVDEPWYS